MRDQTTKKIVVERGNSSGFAELTAAVEYHADPRPHARKHLPGNERPAARTRRQVSPAFIAKCLLKEGDLRAGIPGSDMFTDPAWYILLDLFAAEEEGKR
ncbi:MAG: hypothetical protein QM605_10385 [Sphingobium sp.]